MFGTVHTRRIYIEDSTQTARIVLRLTLRGMYLLERTYCYTLTHSRNWLWLKSVLNKVLPGCVFTFVSWNIEPYRPNRFLRNWYCQIFHPLSHDTIYLHRICYYPQLSWLQISPILIIQYAYLFNYIVRFISYSISPTLYRCSLRYQSYTNIQANYMYIISTKIWRRWKWMKMKISTNQLCDNTGGREKWGSDRGTTWPGDHVTRWSCDRVIMWPGDHMTRWSRDHVTRWSRDRVIMWSPGHVTRWSRDQVVTWPGACF